jgi:arylsulfatase A-like enzyme
MIGRIPCVLGVILAMTTACGQKTPDHVTRSNVILVLVDTLRADHMSTYGYERLTSPYLDEFASNAVVFEHARSQSSCTFPSVNSLMTSRYPDVFARQGKDHFGIPAKYPAIAEILDNNGFFTMAVSQSPVVRKTPSKHNPNGGFGRGFDRFVEGCVWRHGTCLNRRIFKELELVESPFFLYLHYMEPHAPYFHPPEHPPQFTGEYEGFDFIRDGNPKPIGKMIYGDGPQYDLTDRDIQHLIDLYDDEVLFFDDVFRSLLQELEGRGLLEETLIVFASDHGEEFLEHGHISHCRGVWDTVTHVPLFFRIPGVDGQRIEIAVQNLDIVPTILDYLAIDGGGLGFEGKSLRPIIEGREESSLYAFSRQTGFHSSDDGRFHLILDTNNDGFTLFDIRTDPLEQSDLYDPSHPELGPLKSALDGWLEQTSKGVRLHESAMAERAKEEELRALGYLE